ncbi:hypothetical protein [Lachnobacterium bovis]|uniref:hypothetical protein n=1 Tax=Lachnobacterium bovis TaxID=140626 RepID=UPI000480AC7F|nr:hypothetical protein [Lachnobacterium bovis]
MEEKPFEFKYFVIDDMYRDVLNSDDTFVESLTECWVSLCGYINSDTILSIMIVSEIFAVTIANDAEVHADDVKDIEKLLKLYNTLNVKNLLISSEYEYLKEDMKIIEYFYEKSKDVIKKGFPRRASDFFEEIPKFYVEKVLLGEDPNHRLENLTEDNSFELTYLIYAYYYRGIFKDKLTEQQAFDRCLIKFKKYLEEDSIKTVIAVAALTDILVWRNGKSISLTKKMVHFQRKAVKIYDSLDVKNILDGDRLEFLEDSMLDIRSLSKNEGD